MEKELYDTRQAASEAKAKAEKDLEEEKQASASGTRGLLERAERREQVMIHLTLPNNRPTT